MKYISFLIKPASSMCMLKCRYCFYHDVSEHRMMKSHGFMKQEVAHTLIDQACDAVDEDGEITFAFQGGEPTVAGVAFFEEFCSYVSKRKNAKQTIHYAIQTNGYVIDDTWCSLFQKYHFLVGVSLDGYKENHDYFRLTSGNKATFSRVMETITQLRKSQVNTNILTVLSKQLAKHPQKLYDFYKKQGFSYIQLIPCLAGLDEEENPFALTPELFATFYKQFYDLWLKDYQSGNAMSIYLFDNIIPMYANIPPQQCGMLGSCSLQFVVEGDGSVYPCDFYVLDEYCGGNVLSKSLREIANSEPMKRFLQEPKAMSKKCGACAFTRICYGNCKRMNTLYFNDDYCGYQDFLSYAYPSMVQIAKRISFNEK